MHSRAVCTHLLLLLLCVELTGVLHRGRLSTQRLLRELTEPRLRCLLVLLLLLMRLLPEGRSRIRRQSRIELGWWLHHS